MKTILLLFTTVKISNSLKWQTFCQYRDGMIWCDTVWPIEQPLKVIS